jgi:type II secretory pathway pseudopilin PulG
LPPIRKILRVNVEQAVASGLRAAAGLRRILRHQGGFSLLEAVVAVGIIGIAVVSTVVVLNTIVRTSSETEEDLGLIQVLRAQTETVQNEPYKDDPSQYTILTDIPANVTLTLTSTDPGTSYTSSSGANLGQVIQQIVVTAAKNESEASVTFYKIKLP